MGISSGLSSLTFKIDYNKQIACKLPTKIDVNVVGVGGHDLSSLHEILWVVGAELSEQRTIFLAGTVLRSVVQEQKQRD